MTNTKLFEDKIREKGLKKSYICEKLGISHQAFINKFTNVSEFTSSELKILVDLLGIETLEELQAIFFATIDDLESSECDGENE